MADDMDGAFASYATATLDGLLERQPEWATGVGDHRYDDRLFSLIVDVDDTAENLAWISHLKSHLLQRFEQLEIYVTSYPIEVL